MHSRFKHIRSCCFATFWAALIPFVYDQALAQATNPPLIGMNINGVSYYDGNYMFADCVKQSSRWGSNASPYDGTTPIDANGWPTTDCGFLVIDGVVDVNGVRSSCGGTYHLQATGLITHISGWNTPVTVTNYAYSTASNTTTADLTVPSATILVYLNFTGTSRAGGTPVTGGTGFTNLKVMRPVGPNAATAYPVTTVFTDQIKTMTGNFQVLRFMDYMGINNSTETNWADRKLPGKAGGSKVWEYAIQLCNQSGNDLYVNIPEKATGATSSDTTSYIYKLAQLIRYGSDAAGNVYTSTQTNPVNPPLASNLNVYIEYSNEIWNTAVAFHDDFEYNKSQAIQEVVNSNFTSNLFYTGDSTTYSGTDNEGDPAYANRYNWAYRRHARRIKETSDIFRAVFGDEAMLARVRPLLEWQYANTNSTANLEVTFLDKIFNNGDGVQHAATPHPVGYYIWGGGGATYCGAQNNGATDSTGTKTVDALYASGIPSTGLVTTMATEALWARSFGLHTAAYEGGWSVSDPNDVQTAIQRMAKLDPRSKQTVIDFQKQFDSVGGDLNMIYRVAGPDEWSVCDPTNYANPNPPQVQGYMTAQQSNVTTPSSTFHPGFATLVPGTVTGTASGRAGVGGFDGGGGVLGGFGTNCWSSYLIAVPTSGNYYITASMATPIAGGLVDILADDQLVASAAIPNTGNYSVYQSTAPTIVYLPAGSHSLRLKIRAGGGNLASVTIASGVTVARQIACGSTVAVGSFAADNSYAGGFLSSTAATVYTTGNLAQKAASAIYQKQRGGNFTYTLTGFTPSSVYQVRLHFAELFWGPQSSPGLGKRLVDVTLNTVKVLDGLDVNGVAGGGNKAVVYQFPATSDATGKITIAVGHHTGSFDSNAQLNAIEVLK